jgi:Asp-tRNA(Asn)/Glu-tRNA(Gln) amidotransferase A subunit family amidase
MVWGITALRNPDKSAVLAGDGQESIQRMLRPLANTIADLDVIHQAILDQEPWEEETPLVPMPWKRTISYEPSDFTIGMIWDDGLVHPHPPVTRGLTHAVERLKAAGVKIVNFEPFNHTGGSDSL